MGLIILKKVNFMEQVRTFKKKAIFFLVLCLISLFGVFYIKMLYMNDHYQNGVHGEQYEKILKEKEQKLQALLFEVINIENDKPPFLALHHQLQPELWQKEGLSLLLYKNDSLVFWSNNNVPAEKYLNRLKFNPGFIHYGNGWFRVLTETRDNLFAVGLILVKNDYPYQNEYLVDNFQEDFNLIPGAEIDSLPGQINVISTSGEFLFSVTGAPAETVDQALYHVVFLFWIIFIISFIVLLFYTYHIFDFISSRPLLLLFAFTFDAVLFRLILLYFKIPGFLYHSDLFSPYYFATSFLSPSLGDLVINSLFLLTLASVFYNHFPREYTFKSVMWKWLTGFAVCMINGLLFLLLVQALKRIIIDSNIELNLNNIFSIGFYSGLGFLSMISLVLAYFLVSSRMVMIMIKLFQKRSDSFFIIIGSSLIIALVYIKTSSLSTGLVLIFFFIIYLFTLFYFSTKEKDFRNIIGAMVYVVFFSLLTTYILDVHLTEREKEKRKLLASELTSKRDPLMEYEFYKASNEIIADSALFKLLAEWQAQHIEDQVIHKYISDKFFNNFWNSYDLLITICKPEDVLNIQPEGYLENCFLYFSGILSAKNSESLGNGLYFLPDRMGMSNYIAGLDFNLDTQGAARPDAMIYIEITQKYMTETGLGYPDLLIDQKVQMISGLEDYSYAKYSQNELIYKNGDFSYHLGFDTYNKEKSQSYFVDNEGYNHYIFKSDDNKALIISKKNPTLLDLVAPFSYLFMMFSVFLIVFLLGFIISGGIKNIEFNFSNQLQISIIFIIIVSFLILGMISRSNIIHLYNNKNRDNLSEKAFSVLTEIEHKLGEEARITPDLEPYIGDLLYKFSMIFYSDINLFNTEGDLIASSRPQIFQEKLLSGKINPNAFYRLAVDGNLLYIQNEKIGGQEYLSAYIPFRNNQDQIIAYLNLPYFAKQTELRKEISDFLATYINVYVLLIVLAIVVTILVSRLISRPLQIIREKMGEIGLGKTNEKIEWKRKDEIGRLVDEYNRMIEELARSAELLARSERESAWREMAKQVAHEIKNPLTPMKLSVQYLQKAWDEKAPDWDRQLARFTNTIVEQIDTLSEIASEFSDFAKMPAANITKVDLAEVVTASVNLYSHQRNLEIILDKEQDRFPVLADQKQLLRVFNNLLQNAIQAIGKKEDGKIRIQITREGDYYKVDVTDNGIGISDEQAKKIFSPSFTTKSSGMGLGLAMSRSILTSINGTISFESQPESGTTFTVKIPAINR